MTALLIALLTFLTVAVIGLAVARRRSNGATGRGPGDEEGGDDGGSQPRVPPRTPPGPPDDIDPEWWPQFERDLADHIRRTDDREAGTRGLRGSG